MIVELYVRMFYVLVLCPVLLASAVLTLTVDSQLGTSVEDCFDRISIGEQLPRDAIYRNVTELTIVECEQICKQDKQCQAYVYGVGAKGNATCELSNLSENEIKEKNLFQKNPDYDVYVRRFDCEQSPPTPIEQPFDNSNENGPQHKPVIRPNNDEAKRPMADDLNPYESSRPQPSYASNTPYRPSYNQVNNERPDDYGAYKPDNDRPPSYGDHKPHEAPYRPERPYRNASRPDPYDQLYFQDPHKKPRPGLWRPDPYHPILPGDEIQDIYGSEPSRPQRPDYITEKPQYQYIIRPNRKPYTKPEDQGYYNHAKPEYGSAHLNSPAGPPERPYKPTRPNDKPSYSYTDQYASNYGTSPDNSIYLEIYDPPRPYRPSKNERPYYGAGSSGQKYGQNYGYNSFSNQDTYSQSQLQYGSNSWNYDTQRPQKPSYGSLSNQNDDIGYGSRPPYKPKPSYSSHSHLSQSSYNQALYDEMYAINQQYYNHGHGSGYGAQVSSTYGGSQSQYAQQESHSSSQYGNSQSGYGTQITDHNNRPSNQYGQSGNRNPPSSNYGGQSNQQQESNYGDKNQLTNTQSGYGNQGTNNYGSQSNQYGSNQDSQSDKYSTTQSGYGNQGTSNYGSQSNKYGSNQDSQSNKYSTTQSGYGNQGSSNYGSQSNQYGANEDSQSNKYSTTQSGYGNEGTNNYGSQSNHYGSNQDSQSNKYSTSQSGYGNQEISGYGEQTNKYGSHQDSHNNKIPIPQNGYDNQAPSTNSQSNKYGNNQSYGNQASNTYDQQYGSHQGSQNNQYNTQGGYSNQVNNYGESQYNLDYSNYHGSHLGYGIHHLYGIKPGSYGNEPNDYKPVITNNDPYDNRKPNRPHNDKPIYDLQAHGYGNRDKDYQKPDPIPGYNKERPDIKPGYEHGIDKPAPGYNVGPSGDRVTSRPVAVGQYGRDPGKDISYEACFRRVLAGKRALRSHVRRVVDCERLEDCRRECATERRFHCESFNYRLDPSFRGRGLCELMTKPIEAFDIRQDFVEDKDYDFYELDRNSLEPYCPETLRGPSLLHSGYLSSKPAKVPGQQNQWRDRMDWAEGYKSYNRFYDEKRIQSYNRRYEDQFYVPYQIGISRTNDDQQNFGQYGGYYGGYDSYYKDRNDYHKSINHWRLSDEKKHNEYQGVRHHNEDKDFDYYSLRKKSGWEDYGYGYGSWKRGKWNNSGSFWKDFDGSLNNYHNKATYFEPEARSDESSKDCSSRRRPGMSLGSGAIRRSLLAHTVVECEAACFNEREFKCVSYSYKYSSSPGSDNCFLSERPYRGLEMSADSDSDVYAMPLHQDCLTVSTKPWVESECFWHVRSGSAVNGKAVRAALTVAGLGACEAECIRAHSFFCRGFSFRFDAPTIGDDLENCLLTSSPPTSLDLGHGLRPSKHELYSRGNYGRGCEPALYDDVKREPQCYLQYDSAAKLSASAARGAARAADERACGRACTDAPFRCLSFSYSNNALPDDNNCLLSEIRMFDLQRGVDYKHSPDDLLFAFDLFNGQCWRKVHGKEEYDVPTLELPHPIEASYPGTASGPDLPPPETYISSSGPSGPGFPEPPKPYIPETGPDYKPVYETTGPTKPFLHDTYKPSYLPESGPDVSGPSGPSIPSGPSLPSGPSGPSGPPKPHYDFIEPGVKPSYLRPYKPEIYKPYKPDFPDRKPSYLNDPSGPSYKPPYGATGHTSGQDFGYRPGRPSRPSNQVDESLSLSWRHYTVSGFPCRKGTSCEQNLIAGHWACEPEAGEIGSWDYCCAPTHRCGYSEGFRKPWCYVGPTHDQWRPCSEKYYPYHQHKGPHPSQGQREAVHPRPDRPIQQEDRDRISSKPNYNKPDGDRHHGTYLPEADRRYWDDLYRNGPQAYYDKYGNPLPGYTRVPTEDRPHIKYQRNPPRPGSNYWVPVNSPDDEPNTGGLGVPRYWPVAYLHKGPPPNMTYFRYNETAPERHNAPPSRNQSDFKRVNLDRPINNDLESRSVDSSPRSEKRINITNDDDDIFDLAIDKTTTTMKPEVNETILETVTEVEEKINKTELYNKPENANIEEEDDYIKGIDGKLHDFTHSIEVFDIDDVKGDKISDVKTLEAEEKQIEAIGRIIASRRGGKLIIEKRSQKDLESKSIALDKDFVDFDFGNRFPTSERRGFVRKVTKDDIEKDKFLNDKSLEVSESTFVRPPRILSTTENVRKTVVNGKVFYDATIKDQRELYTNTTRRGKSLRLEENRAPVIPNGNNKKKSVRTRNTNPVRRVRRVYRKKYNPEEVRKRLLERERNKNATDNIKS
ncbi:uncharacterized protein LOC113391806 [Vanessa tameamea]|uniref:Uncharacterized protein LOC113391806 n=1 Tax=Vanessa tameamea TaxID=334116 RepID=A0ABM4AW83_VANTA